MTASSRSKTNNIQPALGMITVKGSGVKRAKVWGEYVPVIANTDGSNYVTGTLEGMEPCRGPTLSRHFPEKPRTSTFTLTGGRGRQGLPFGAVTFQTGPLSFQNINISSSLSIEITNWANLLIINRPICSNGVISSQKINHSTIHKSSYPSSGKKGCCNRSSWPISKEYVSLL